MTDREQMRNAILDLCPHAIETTEYEGGIGCCDRDVECDCFCKEAKIIESAIKAGYRKMDEMVEWQRRQKICNEENTRRILELTEQLENKEKQTVKGIIKKLLAECGCSLHDCVEPDFILRLAKKYGVQLDDTP